MSATTIHRIAANGDVSEFAHCSNSWGFAPAIWDYFGLKHFGAKPSMFGGGADMKRIWDLFGSGKLDALDDLLLGSTFDRVWVKRERFGTLGLALRRFASAYAKPNGITLTSVEVADALDRLAAEDPPVLGAAIDATSTIESWWHRQQKDDDDDTGCFDPPFNVLADKLTSNGEPHWEIGE